MAIQAPKREDYDNEQDYMDALAYYYKYLLTNVSNPEQVLMDLHYNNFFMQLAVYYYTLYEDHGYVYFPLYYASDILRSDKEFISQILDLRFEDPMLSIASSICMKDFKPPRIPLFYASDELRDDKELVLKAVSKTWLSLAFASERLINDKDVVMAASQMCADELMTRGLTSATHGYLFEEFAYASDELKDDKDFVLQILKINGYSFKFVSDRLKNDRDVVIEAVKNAPWTIKFASEELQNDPEIIALSQQK